MFVYADLAGDIHQIADADALFVAVRRRVAESGHLDRTAHGIVGHESTPLFSFRYDPTAVAAYGESSDGLSREVRLFESWGGRSPSCESVVIQVERVTQDGHPSALTEF